MLHRICSIPGALFEMARLAVLLRFNFRGDYWQWRMQTAYGRGMPATRGELVHEALDYFRWARRMRRR